MTQFKGFKTKEAAQKFVKSHGGILTWDKRTPKTHKPSGVGIDYRYAVELGGLDEKKYPFCVQWVER